MSSVLRRYCQAWRMWNSWLKVSERPEIEIETFIESFTLIDHGIDAGTVVGRDAHNDIDITNDRIHISFNGKPRYSWYPYVVSYGDLDIQDEDAHFRMIFGRPDQGL